MISIQEKIYQDLAFKLINEINSTNLFNGTIEIDYSELYTTLHCTLLVYYTRDCIEERNFLAIKDIVPVWWELETASAYGFEHNDFSWGEFYKYLKAYF
ncbi:MAG: hypothetical protein R3Y38_04645 [Rikenellaceae bacterium]